MEDKQILKTIIITLFLIAILSISGLCGEEVKPIDLSADNFQQVLESDKLVVIDFWAKWCTYCKLLDPVIIRLMIFNQQYNKDKIEWYKVDVDKSKRKFLNHFRPLRGLPVLVFYRDGKEVDRMIGFQPFLKIQDKINLLTKEEKKDKKDKKDGCNDGVCPPPEGY